VKSTEPGRIANGGARDLPLGRLLRVVALAAALGVAPLLARTARAQRTAAIQASAYVIHSYLGAGFSQDSVGLTARASLRPPTARLTIAGVGVLDIQTGSDGQMPVTSEVPDRSGHGTVSILVSFVGT